MPHFIPTAHFTVMNSLMPAGQSNQLPAIPVSSNIRLRMKSFFTQSAIVTLFLLAGLFAATLAHAQCQQSFDFSSPVTTSATPAPGTWYTDRYAPAGFTSPVNFMGGDRLLEQINASDGLSSRPAAYQTTFYNTQGRQYQLISGTTYMEISLYIPSDWATSNKRMAGLWGIASDAGNAVSGYPIVEFTSDGNNPRFRGYNNGTYIDMGLPTGSTYNSWVKLSIELLPSGEFRYTAGDKTITTDAFGAGSTQIANVILEGYNYDPANPNNGVTYDIYWDDFASDMQRPTITFTATTSGMPPSSATTTNSSTPVNISFNEGDYFTFSNFRTSPSSGVGVIESRTTSGNVTYQGNLLSQSSPDFNIAPNNTAAFFSATYGPYGVSNGMTGTINQSYTPYVDANDNGQYDAGECKGATVVLNYTISPAPIHAFYVNDNSQAGDHYTTAVGNDNNAGIPAYPFATIQHAINVAVSGDIIYVDAGTYAEDITVTKSLDIRGANYNISPNGGTRVAEAIVVPATSHVDYNEVFHVAASNVSINGFTIDGNNMAINSGYLGTNGADLDAAEGVTVYEDNISNLTVLKNIFQNLSYTGVTLYGASFSSPATSGHSITDNLMRNLGTYDASSGIAQYGTGVLLYNNQYAAVTNNTMTNVRVGVQTGNFAQANPGTTASQVISGNTITARRRGIFHNLFYASASGYTLSNNSITAVSNTNEAYWNGMLLASLSVPSASIGNTIDGTATIGYTNPTSGIDVWNVKNTTPAAISGGSVTGVANGVFVNNFDSYPSAGSNATDGGNATLAGIAITNVTTGIRVKDNMNSTHAPVTLAINTGVTVSNATDGLVIENSQALVSSLSNLAFSNISNKYISLNANANNLDARAVTFNGQTGGGSTLSQNYTIEDKINHKIDLVTLGFVLVKTDNDFVTPNSFIAPNTAANVQRGIDAAGSGFILNVQGGGSYVGNTIVNKSLSILGPNDATAGCATRAAEAVLVPASSQPYYDGTTEVRLMQIEASNVAVKGLTFDGDNTNINGTSIDAADGIDVYEDVSDITIQNNIFKNLNEGGINAYPSGITSQQNNVITNNKFDNIAGVSGGMSYPNSGYGIGVLIYNNFYTTVDNNCMTNVRIGVQTGNYNLAGSPASISNNQIESKIIGIWHNLAYQSASTFIINSNTLTTTSGATTNTGLFVSSLYNNVSATVINNTVTNAKWGIELWNNPTTSKVTISGGTLTNCETGIFANNYDSYASNGESSSYVIDGVTITSNVANNIGVHVKDNSANTNGATTTVTTQNNTAITTTGTGLLLTGQGSFAAFGTGTPPATFTGQAKYITLTDNGTDVPVTGINATAVTFDGQTGATASPAQNFAIEDKIDHKIDLLPLGFVTVKASNAFVTDIAPLAPTATNNDYTRVRNGILAASTGFTINHDGTFNWVEPNAATAWAAGNDGVTGTADDYSILIPNNLNTVTFTTPAPVTPATIQGPGDLLNANLEGVLVFDGTLNQGWTISNMKFQDFDLSIGMFNGAGGADAFDNTTITNNFFRIPKDLNSAVAPSDASQNIGIHYSFGSNQTISNNTFEVDGTGVSNGTTNLSTSIVMQSNTSGGATTYDGLQITGNTITVTGVPATNPNQAVIRGIWENSQSTGAAINISSNLFTNAAAGNTATLNRQTAFWVTSNSDASKKVEYKNNEVSGYRDGIAWLGGMFTSNSAPDYNTGETPTEIMNNKFDGVQFGVVVRKSTASTNPGSPALINFNSFTNTPSGGFAISNEGTGSTGATCNSYGTTNASAVAAMINGPVTYIPYLTNGTDNDLATRGFQTNELCGACTILTETHTTTANSCNGGSNGTITITASGGVGSYTYTISPSPGSVMQPSPGMFTGLPAGSYTITAYGANGCSTTFNPITVGQPTGTAPDANLNIAAASSYFFPTPMTENTFVYQIFESAGNPITGVTLRINKQNGYTYSFNMTATSTTVGGNTYPVDNTRWTADDSDGNNYIIRLNPGNQISCQSVINLEVKLTRNTSNKSNFSVTSLILGVPGETNFSTNTTTYQAVGN